MILIDFKGPHIGRQGFSEILSVLILGGRGSPDLNRSPHFKQELS